MSRRHRGGTTERQPWDQFAEAVPSPESVARVKAAGLPPALLGGERLMKNNRYTVVITTYDAPEVPGGKIVHLSIKRNDRKPMRDWRDLQRIKNELVGYECEAVELFPAESRLVDMANQFHLWCLPRGYRFPFGFDEGRQVDDDPEMAAAFGAVQRRYEP